MMDTFPSPLHPKLALFSTNIIQFNMLFSVGSINGTVFLALGNRSFTYLHRPRPCNLQYLTVPIITFRHLSSTTKPRIPSTIVRARPMPPFNDSTPGQQRRDVSPGERRHEHIHMWVPTRLLSPPPCYSR